MHRLWRIRQCRRPNSPTSEEAFSLTRMCILLAFMDGRWWWCGGLVCSVVQWRFLVCLHQKNGELADVSVVLPRCSAFSKIFFKFLCSLCCGWSTPLWERLTNIFNVLLACAEVWVSLVDVILNSGVESKLLGSEGESNTKILYGGWSWDQDASQCIQSLDHVIGETVWHFNQDQVDQEGSCSDYFTNQCGYLSINILCKLWNSIRCSTNVNWVNWECLSRACVDDGGTTLHVHCVCSKYIDYKIQIDQTI